VQPPPELDIVEPTLASAASRERGGGAELAKPRASVTLEDVAREANVHYSTVSRALDPQKAFRVSEATRTRVQAIARRLGYLPDVMASGLKRGRSQTVAVVVGDLTNPNVAPVLRGIAAGLEPRGLMPLICETHDDSERLEQILNLLLSRRIDAILLSSATMRDGSLLRKIRGHNVPLVLAVQNCPGVRLPLCAYDDFLGGRLAAQHLLALGHRRLAQLRGPMDITSCRDRAIGFSKTVEAAGATEITVDGEAPTGSVEDGRRLMRKVLDRRRALPTAIFNHHDLMAIGALKLAREYGLRCPDDISFVGYHDLPGIDEVVPPLTSIRLPREELGRVAAEMMLERLASNERPVVQRRLTPTLVVRGSTAAPPRTRRG